MVTTKARLQGERRKRKLHLAKITFCFLLVVGCIAGADNLVHQPWFTFGELELVGSNKITKAEVMRTGEIKEPINLFVLDRTRLEKGLEHDIRVAKVTTNFEWPNRLKIVIVERQVAIYIESSYNSFAQLDFNGYVLNVARGIKDASAPYVSGLKVGNVYVGDQVKTPEIQALIGFLGKLEPALLGKISELRCDGQGKVKVIMVSGLCIHLGAIKEMENKAENFITISNEVQSKNINAEYIDLTFTKPYIKVKK